VRAAWASPAPVQIDFGLPFQSRNQVSSSELDLLPTREDAAMQAAVERVMKTYGMLVANLTDEEFKAAREKVTSFLAEKPETTEDRLAVEGLRYLRVMRDL
jgi:hypothetical protein